MLCVGSCLKPKPLEVGRWPCGAELPGRPVSTAATWLGLSMQGPKELQASAESRTPNLCRSEGPQADAQLGYRQTPTGFSSHITEGIPLQKEGLPFVLREEMLDPNKQAPRSGLANLPLL